MPLAEGTHTIIMEKNRLKPFEAVQAFLDQGRRSWNMSRRSLGRRFWAKNVL